MLRTLSDRAETMLNQMGETTAQFDLEKENIYGIFSNMTLLSMLLMSLSKHKKSFKNPVWFNDEYDYIIVGGGSAGSVMASRLSEEPCISVLLLEAGGEPPLLTEIPAFPLLLLYSEIDWKYKTTPQKYSASELYGEIVTLNSGRVLGGSSTLNAMMYVRGNKKNYDDWAADGAEGWGYEDVLPYFKKLEDNRNIESVDKGYHGQGGPVTIENPAYTAEIKEPLLRTMNAMGFETLDVNGRRQTGVFDIQATTRNHQRCSAAKAYLDGIRDRPNLHILTHAFARKILIDRNPSGDSRAYGIEFERFNVTYTVRAKREVIICSGTVRTPQILMLSGIGPREHLEKFNIEVIADLPVGKNLQDHSAAALLYSVNESIVPAIDKVFNSINIMDYITNRKGPLTAPAMTTLIAFLNGVNTTHASEDFPRHEIFIGEYIDPHPIYRLDKTEEHSSRKMCHTRPTYICASTLLQPYSRGDITLMSLNPHDMPNIDPKYLKDKRDLKNIVDGLEICDKIAEHPEMREIQPRLDLNLYLACAKYYTVKRSKYYNCVAKKYTTTIWHYVGTAKMGSRTDPRSVVDPELRVIGVKNLRIVSGAVLPILPSANTNVPIMMVAEKASDIIKKDINCRKTQHNACSTLETLIKSDISVAI